MQKSLRLSCTSVLMTTGLFPRVSRKSRGDNIVPMSWRSPNLSLSVSVVAEIPASGPRLGREPAVTEGSGICPGIASGSALTTATGGKEGKWEKRSDASKNKKEKKCCYFYSCMRAENQDIFLTIKVDTHKALNRTLISKTFG